jgi:predicted RNase H-like HicB family nuclease
MKSFRVYLGLLLVGFGAAYGQPSLRRVLRFRVCGVCAPWYWIKYQEFIYWYQLPDLEVYWWGSGFGLERLRWFKDLVAFYLEVFKFLNLDEVIGEMLRLSVIVEQDVDGWFIGTVPELPGCHSQARTFDDLMSRIREAVDLYIDVDGLADFSSREFVGVF